MIFILMNTKVTFSKTSLTMRATCGEREREHRKRGDPKWMIFIQVNNNVVPQSKASLRMRAIGGEQ
jgi:hypothetical protein